MISFFKGGGSEALFCQIERNNPSLAKCSTLNLKTNFKDPIINKNSTSELIY